MAEQILIILIAIVLASFILERFLDLLNLRFTVPELPSELKGIFKPAEYRKSQAYKRENTLFSFFTSSISLLLTLAVLIFGWFGWLDQQIRTITDSYYILVLLFFAVIAIISDLLATPFQVYDTFKIEEKYGFNKTTVGTFIGDKLKGWLVSAVIGGGILLLITWFYRLTGEYFWLLAWGAITLFSIFMNMFYSNLIVPLFNKQTPLEQGELRIQIEGFAQRAGFELKDIYVIDGSRRSTKANAYFTGLGPKKRIVLYDTLINDLDTEEIVAVLAHEIGHYKKKHSIKGLISGVIQTGIMLYIFSLLVSEPALSQALGAETASFHMGLIAFAILYSPVSLFLGILGNMVSRKHEYEADAFATEYLSSGKLISALKKLTSNNLSNLTPHPAYVFFNYSHPPLLKRIRAMQE